MNGSSNRRGFFKKAATGVVGFGATATKADAAPEITDLPEKLPTSLGEAP